GVPAAGNALDHRTIVGGTRGERLAGIVRDAEPSTEISHPDVVAGAAKLRDQFADTGKGALERIEAGELAADMDCDALDLEARQCRDATVSLYRIADRDPELVLGGARRDLGMAAGGDIRIDPEADRSGPPHANRNR